MVKEKAYESPSAKFETAFLPGYNWSANGLVTCLLLKSVPAKGFYSERSEQTHAGDTVVHDGSSLLLRYEKEINKKVESARAFITGVGYYEFFINGKRVGDHLLAPAKTPYHKYILYDSYDVTSLIKEGSECFRYPPGQRMV